MLPLSRSFQPTGIGGVVRLLPLFGVGLVAVLCFGCGGKDLTAGNLDGAADEPADVAAEVAEAAVDVWDGAVADAVLGDSADADACGGPGQDCCNFHACAGGGCCVYGKCNANGASCGDRGQVNTGTGTAAQCLDGRCVGTLDGGSLGAEGCGAEGKKCCSNAIGSASCTAASLTCKWDPAASNAQCVPCGGAQMPCCYDVGLAGYPPVQIGDQGSCLGGDLKCMGAVCQPK
jgi:hypothetical protein